MAFFDDNNEKLAGSGKDPLKELDDELESLMQRLGELENTKEDPAEPADLPKVTDEAQPSGADDPSPLDEEAPSPDPEPEASTAEETDAVSPAPLPEKKRSKLPLILTIAIVSALLIAGIWFLLNLPLSSFFGGDTVETSDGNTVTIHDSEMGTVEITPVQGAPVNTYDESNLRIDENGLYSYWQDGQKISELGVDLSEMQGEIDFEKLKAAGVDFVILRVGGRYYSEEGGIYADDSFSANYDKAKAAGLKVGAYFFSQATTPEEAKEEAQFALDQVGGRALDYPIAFDWENIDSDAARTDDVYGDTLTEMAKAFCDTVEAAGYRSMVYASSFQMFKSYDFETMKDYSFWLADYRDFPNMYYDFTMWQYSKEGVIDGVDGTVDLDICFKPY